MPVSRRRCNVKKLLATAILLLATSGQGIAAPQRIMSLKLCTDQVLMDLVPASRIASISFLSRESAALKAWPQAAAIPINHNTAEEVLAVHPDLVLTDNFTAPAMRAVLARSGAKILEVPEARNFGEIRAVMRLVGDAVGARPKAEALIARMDETLRRLAATVPARPIRVAGWGGGGFVPGRDGLFNTILAAAGAVSVAPGGGGYYDVESLIAAKPDVLAYGDNYSDMPTLRADQNDHPALLKLYGKRRVSYPSPFYGCGLPQSADAAAALRLQLQQAMQP